MVTRRQVLKGALAGGVGLVLPLKGLTAAVQAQGQGTGPGELPPGILKRPVTPADRKKAAENARAAGLQPGAAAVEMVAMAPGTVPHYFGPYPNYANSPVPRGAVTEVILEDGGSGYTAPTVTISDVYATGTGATAKATVVDGVITALTLTNGGSNYSAPVVSIEDTTGTGAFATATIGGALTGGIRKFVDSLPLPNQANNLGQMVPVAVPDTTTYADADYYEIELVQYTQQLNSDLPPTTLRGYRQTNMGGSGFHYAGPLIITRRGRPVRIKFTNNLPTGEGGDLFIPVDTTVMGAGMGPQGGMFTQNRATVHLHGGFVPWISDGTPHQWITPANENTPYPKGVSVRNVPDMPDPGDGSMTLYYNNAQSARLQFYHDHAWGITRLNVYAGEAAGYIIRDDVEDDLVYGTNVTGVNPDSLQVIPSDEIPLIIQDKTFVDADTIPAQDPLWRWGTGDVDPATGYRMPKTGDLWLPSVYVPAQNPWDPSGANPFGRWHYGPWFWPPTENIEHPPIPNPYYDGVNPYEPPYIPDMPDPSMGMEAFMDTTLVNGTVYPYLEVDPKAYRFRILSIANDRFFNLQWYVADDTVVTSDGRTNTEVKMVPATIPNWATDNREGGVPDPATAGPDWIQIGTEGGFLPAPVVVPTRPITWQMDATLFNVGNVLDHSLLLAPAERADVIVDFSQFAGQTLILYNDAPAAFPALDPRYDYYTGDPDLTDTGGTPPTQPGYGPNTRTIMQVRVRDAAPAPAYDLAALQSVFAKTADKPGVFELSQDPIIIPQAAYNSAYNTTFPADIASQYVRIFESSKSITPVNPDGTLATARTIQFEPKAIQDEMGEAFDKEYGRMSGFLGLELPNTIAGLQNFMLYGYSSPPTDLIQDSMTLLGTTSEGIQIWKITHNGVDTHPIHFHLFNVQLINRVAWDNLLMPPDPNELGWKDTVRVNPLEDTIVALKPKVPPETPFDVPNSIRLIDPSMPEGMMLADGYKDEAFNPDAEPVTIINHYVNFGWEYVWHCHILSHEEMDMMHSLVFGVAPNTPTNLTVTTTGKGNNQRAILTWTDNASTETAYIVERSNSASGPWTTLATLPADSTTYTDTTYRSNQGPFYYRVIARNVIGDTWDYSDPQINEVPPGGGFPNRTIDSAPAVIGAPMGTTTITSISVVTNRNSATVTLNWTYEPSGDQAGFTIQRAPDDTFSRQVTTFTAAANERSYVDSSARANRDYYYRIAAVNGLGTGTWSNVVTTIGAAAMAADPGGDGWSGHDVYLPQVQTGNE